MPAVSWIPLHQSETSTRTSLKSVADYLSETPEEVFVSQRSLCVSPETLDVLENAEKLLEDTEKQLSQMNFFAFDDDESNKENGYSHENIYVRNVVASMFEKGYYDPGPVPMKSHFTSKLTLSGSAGNMKPPIYRHFRPAKQTSVTTLEKIPAANDCLLCKSKRNDPPKQNTEDLRTEPVSNKRTDDSGKPDKLNLQRGPSISIKGDFSVQTVKIVDIRPDPAVCRVSSSEQMENVATFVCHHDPNSKKNSINSNSPASPRTPRTADKVEIDPNSEVPITSVRESLEIKKTVEPSRSKENSIEDYLAEMQLCENRKKSAFWEKLESLGLEGSLSDLSLREPPILTEMDSVLEHRWNVIRQVQGATERFDQFIADRLPAVSVSQGDGIVAEKKIGDCKITELTRQIKALNRNKNFAPSTSRAPEPIAPTASKTIITDRYSDVDFTDEDVTLDSSAIERPDNNDSAPEKCEVPKDIRGFGSPKPEAEGENEEAKEDRSVTRTSTHTETKSTSGIENVKSAQIWNDNNLDVNLNQRDTGGISRDGDDQIVEKVENPSRDENGGAVAEVEKSLFKKKMGNDDNGGKGGSSDREVSRKVESKQRDSTERVSERLDENSQKTSHLVESISDISSDKVKDYVDNLSNSLRLSTLSNDKSDNVTSKTKGNLSEKSASEGSTESKIEKQISEARENLNNLITSIDNKDNGVCHVDDESIGSVQREFDEVSTVFRVPETPVAKLVFESSLKSDLCRLERSLVMENTALVCQKPNLFDSRSLVTALEENSSGLKEAVQQRKINILNRLESCAIGSQRQGKGFFTSTVLADTELPGNTSSLRKIKGLSESSSDTHSEGEIRLSRSTSYSAGEVKRRFDSNKSSSSIKSSLSDNCL